MATLITKKSSTSGVVPQPTDLQVGELAVNTADGKLFTKHTDDSIVDLSGSGSMTGQPIFISNTAPSTTGKYLWIQTGLGDTSSDFTFWIEDGT